MASDRAPSRLSDLEARVVSSTSDGKEIHITQKGGSRLLRNIRRHLRESQRQAHDRGIHLTLKMFDYHLGSSRGPNR